MDPVSLVKSKLFPKPAGGKVILELDLARGVLSAPPESPLQAFRTMNAPTMRAIREGLREAATDDAVRGLLVHVGGHLSLSEYDELGDLIEEFGRHKPTAAFSESFGELGPALLGYRLATRAQQVWLQPTGGLGIQGVALDIVLLRGGLAKLGVEFQMSQRKEFKTAGDQMSAEYVTDANREMMTRLAESIVAESVEVIARRRELSTEQVWDAVNNAPLTAEQAKQRGLVDHLGYRDEAYAALRSEWDVPVGEEKPSDTLRYVHRYGPQSGPLAALSQLADRTKPAVAVVGVRGGIVSGRGQQGGPGGASAGSDEVREHLRAAARDDKVKAIVLRVDSPGGSYVASDAIWREVHQVRERGLPVVASMGDLAASGGYYVSMGADEIVANPGTLTGSIGVVAGKAVTQGFFDKIGVIRESVRSGRNADMLGGAAPFDDEQWQLLNTWLDEVYDDFTGKAAADRGMPIEQLEPLARGRVWTGADAKTHGLVDHLGGLDTAIERACALAGLQRDKIAVRGVPAIPMLERLKPAESSESLAGAATAIDGWLRVLQGRVGVEEAAGLFMPDGVLTCPWHITIR